MSDSSAGIPPRSPRLQLKRKRDDTSEDESISEKGRRGPDSTQQQAGPVDKDSPPAESSKVDSYSTPDSLHVFSFIWLDLAFQNKPGWYATTTRTCE